MISAIIASPSIIIGRMVIIVVVAPVPGIIVPGIPIPAAVIPGAVVMAVTVPQGPGIPPIPGFIEPGIVMPGPVIPGIVPAGPGSVIPVIIPVPGHAGIYDGKDGGVVAETDLFALRHHQGISFTENIDGRLFTLSEEIVHLCVGNFCLGDGGGRTAVNAVIVDLSLETGHGRAGKGGKGG